MLPEDYFVPKHAIAGQLQAEDADKLKVFKSIIDADVSKLKENLEVCVCVCVCVCVYMCVCL